MPGYTILSGFIDVGITESLSLSLNANNILNSLGFTEAEEGEIVEGQVNYLRARSITGRSISMTLTVKYLGGSAGTPLSCPNICFFRRDDLGLV